MLNLSDGARLKLKTILQGVFQVRQGHYLIRRIGMQLILPKCGQRLMWLRRKHFICQIERPNTVEPKIAEVFPKAAPGRHHPAIGKDC